MTGWQAEWGMECTVGSCTLGLLIPEPSLFFPAAAPGPLEGKRERSRRMVLLIQLTTDNLPSKSHPWVLVFMDLNFKPLVGEAWNLEDISLFIHQFSKRGVNFHFILGTVLGTQNILYQCLAHDIGSKVNDCNSVWQVL